MAQQVEALIISLNTEKIFLSGWQHEPKVPNLDGWVRRSPKRYLRRRELWNLPVLVRETVLNGALQMKIVHFLIWSSSKPVCLR